MRAYKALYLIPTPLAVCLTPLISCNKFSAFRHKHMHTDTHMHTWHQRGTPLTQHLSFGFCLMSKPESQVVEDIKTEKEKEDQNYQSSKAGGTKPRCDSPFLLLTFSLSSDTTWSLAQVTALFNDAICLMPSCGCQSISHYPSSCLSYCITRTPWLQHTKEPRLKHRCSGPLGASSKLIGGRHHVKDKEETTTSNNKNRGEEDGDGHIFYPASSLTFPFCWSGRFHHGTNWDEGGSQRGESVKP